jgi:hypothetical protein
MFQSFFHCNCLLISIAGILCGISYYSTSINTNHSSVFMFAMIGCFVIVFYLFVLDAKWQSKESSQTERVKSKLEVLDSFSNISVLCDQLLLGSSIFLLYSVDEMYDRYLSLSIATKIMLWCIVAMNFIVNFSLNKVQRDYQTNFVEEEIDHELATEV